GSTYKKAVSSARMLIKMLRGNKTIVIIADGSRGPRQKAQAGSIQIAGITGVPIVPLGCNAENKIEFNSWDRFNLPLPFTRCVLDFGPPIEVPRKADEKNLLEKQVELENELNRLIT
ncbi:MAG: lysophospholipid acyltransferase family protein, partial [Nitrospinales bacterium]